MNSEQIIIENCYCTLDYLIEEWNKNNKTNIKEEDLKEGETSLQDLKLYSLPSSPFYRYITQEQKEEIKQKINYYSDQLSQIQKEFLVESNKRETKSSKPNLEILKEASSSIQEMIQVGEGITTNLQKQKETIQKSRKNLEEINKDLSYSTRLLTSMSRWWKK